MNTRIAPQFAGVTAMRKTMEPPMDWNQPREACQTRLDQANDQFLSRVDAEITRLKGDDPAHPVSAFATSQGAVIVDGADVSRLAMDILQTQQQYVTSSQKSLAQDSIDSMGWNDREVLQNHPQVPQYNWARQSEWMLDDVEHRAKSDVLLSYFEQADRQVDVQV